IEEAAGITKYKSRRRSAELKLEAAQQNLARIDDIVFEVEKQRGTLKRQAAKARRYKKLREELRRWEKVLFARRYRERSTAIEARRAAALEAEQARDAAAAQLEEATEEHARARAGIEGLEAEVDGVRTQVYNGSSAMTAIRHAVQHAAAQADRVAELLGKLD